MPVLYKLNKDNRKGSRTAGLYFARAVHVGVIDTEGLAKIMQTNCTIKAADIKMPWGKLLRLLITVLTAIATTIGVTSCTGHGPF